MHNNSYTFSDAWNYDECLNVHYKCKWNRNWTLGVYYIIGNYLPKNSPTYCYSIENMDRYCNLICKSESTFSAEFNLR